jgi:lysylphosphatidylglycerol synthetase-like protein (DUF2156 family)
MIDADFQYAIAQDDLGDLVRRFGGVLSPVVFDEGCELLRAPWVRGVLPYRRSLGGVVVAVGDPICDPHDQAQLLSEARERFGSVVVAGASRTLVPVAHALGFAVIEFGEQIWIDPGRERPRGRRGHELKRKLNHARSAGLVVQEYDGRARDARLEATLSAVAKSWLHARKGLQIFVAHIDLFYPRALRRWFYATRDGRVVGVQSLVRLDGLGGYLLEHLLTEPDVPAGTAELLVVVALDTLGREGCGFASFGVSTAASLGLVSGLSSSSIRLGRWFFDQAQRSFHLDSVSRFRRKFGEVVVDPSYLLFSPARVGPLQLLGLMRAFNASLAW